MARTGAWLVGAVVGLGALALASGEVPCEVIAAQPSCTVVMEPGPSENTLGLVSIQGAERYEPRGELRLTTVAVRDELTWRTWFGALWSGVVDTVPRETVYPAGLDRDQVAEENAALMADSQLVATIAALEELGYELRGEGALVAAVTEDAVTDELRVGDVIVAVEDRTVEENRDLVEIVRASDPGATMLLEVEGPDGRRRVVSVTLGASPDDPSVPYVGVLLTTRLELPVDVTIDAGVIGGPSAGMMFALSIVELLEPEDLTAGRVVAGTGTLDRDGLVGAVGGVRQKVAGATAPTDGTDPASVFLVPRGNLDDARSASVSRDILLVPIDTLGDALDALTALRAGREPVDAQVLAAGR